MLILNREKHFQNKLKIRITQALKKRKEESAQVLFVIIQIDRSEEIEKKNLKNHSTLHITIQPTSGSGMNTERQLRLKI